MKITEAIFAGSSTRVSEKPKEKLPEIAFIGRSNVGKSSLINMLTGRSKLAMTSSTPGKTKVVNHFLVNDSWYLVDLPGYGYAKLPAKMRDRIAEVIRQYIMESPDLAMLFVLIDCRHDIGAVDTGFIDELGEHGIPFTIIFTKTDKLGPNALQAQIARDCEILSRTWEEMPPMLSCSSARGSGRDEILDYIQNIIDTL